MEHIQMSIINCIQIKMYTVESVGKHLLLLVNIAG